MTTGVTFDSDPDVLLGGSGSDDISDHHASSEFNAKFGKPAESPATEDKNFGYKVVGRLSRWEGGNSTPYQQGKLEAGADANLEDVEPEKITFREFVKQFFKPSYDLTEVTIEDIERVKLMHDRFIGDAQFNFNYSTLLLIASVIAAVGLGSDSTASVIASMLVSPYVLFCDDCDHLLRIYGLLVPHNHSHLSFSSSCFFFKIDGSCNCHIIWHIDWRL